MLSLNTITILATFISLVTSVEKLDEVFNWKQVSFAWPNEDLKNAAIKSGDYIPENNLPLGIERWKNKMFITVPRWKGGVASSLNYVPLDSPSKSPELIPYPDWKTHSLPKGDEKPNENQIVSTFRIKADSCDRLWLLDTGVLDILGEKKQIVPPAVVIIDLKTDKIVRRYTLKPTDYNEDTLFPNINVDVSNDDCDNAFAYFPDPGGCGLVVYSWANNDSWRIKHNYFHLDPLKGDFNVSGVKFHWPDCIFGIAFGPSDNKGFRTAYFEPLTSTHIFSVNTQVLSNKSLALEKHSYDLYSIEGQTGENTQASSTVFDEKSNVLFLTQIQLNGFACWNPRNKLEPKNVPLLAHDDKEMIFTNDLTIDSDRNLWIFPDRMPIFVYSKLDSNDINYRIFKTKVDDIIAGTVCVA